MSTDMQKLLLMLLLLTVVRCRSIARSHEFQQSNHKQAVGANIKKNRRFVVTGIAQAFGLVFQSNAYTTPLIKQHTRLQHLL